MRWKKVVCASILYTLETLSVLNFLPALVGFLGSAAGAATVGAVGAIGGSLVASHGSKRAAEMSASGAREANEMQMQMARENREFERDTAYEMMQKRHQWEVNDLRAAGLNPILSAHSAPSMGNVSADTPPLQNEKAQAAQIHAASAQQVFNNYLALKQQKNNDMVARTQALHNSALAEKENAHALVLLQQHGSNLFGTQADLNIANAAEARAMVNKLGTDMEVNYHRMAESVETRKNLIKQREVLEQEIKESKTREQEIRTRSELNRVNSEIGKVEKRLRSGAIVLQSLEILERQFGMPERELEGRAFTHAGSALDAYEDSIEKVVDWIMRGMPVEVNVPPGTRPNTRLERGTGGR